MQMESSTSNKARTASSSPTHKTAKILRRWLTQTVTLPGWASRVDQITQKVTTSLAEAFYTRGGNRLTAMCPAGYISTVPRNQLIQQQPVNKNRDRQWGQKLVAMGFWMFVDATERKHLPLKWRAHFCWGLDRQNLLCWTKTTAKKKTSTNQFFHYRILKSDLFYVKHTRTRGGVKKKKWQGEIMSFVSDANQLYSRVFLDQKMVSRKKTFTRSKKTLKNADLHRKCTSLPHPRGFFSPHLASQKQYLNTFRVVSFASLTQACLNCRCESICGWCAWVFRDRRWSREEP